MASLPSNIEALKGVWEFVDGENFEEYLKEMGISWLLRQAAKAVKSERITINEDGNGKWTVKSESTFKNTTYEFTPDVEFNELRADGAEVKSTITFKDGTGHWIQKTIDKQGRQARIERYVDDKDHQQIEMVCGNVKAKRWYKRVA